MIARTSGGRALGGLLFWLGLAAAGGWGCRPAPPKPASAPSPPATLPALKQSTPAEVARSLLETLRRQRDARLAGDSKGVASCRRRLHELAARDRILSRFRRVSRRNHQPEEVLATYVQGWEAIVACYVHGLQLDRLQVEPGAQVGQAMVYVPATSGARSETIRIECARGADGLWRVARIDFATGTPPAPQTSPAP